jgi:hypothetical protein
MFNSIIFGQGVNFEQLTFDEALAKAKTENKLIFLDCYTSWCLPCKRMVKDVFSQEKAGKYFNSKFICVKCDIEKGEGPEVAKKLNVKVVPTFFIIRPDGSIQHVIVGGRKIDDFIDKIEKGANEKTSLDYLNKLYEKGKMNKKQLLSYRIALLDANDRAKSEKIGEELNPLLKDKDKMKKEFWIFMRKEVFGSDNFKLVVNNIATFRKNIGKEQIDSYLYYNYKDAIENTIKSNAKEPLAQLEQIRRELTNSDLEKQDLLITRLDLYEAAVKGDTEKVISLVAQKDPKNDLYPIIEVLNTINHKTTKEQRDRIVILGERFIANASNEKTKAYLKEYFQQFQNTTHK